jgi:hypothetical protein
MVGRVDDLAAINDYLLRVIREQAMHVKVHIWLPKNEIIKRVQNNSKMSNYSTRHRNSAYIHTWSLEVLVVTAMK